MGLRKHKATHQIGEQKLGIQASGSFEGSTKKEFARTVVNPPSIFSRSLRCPRCKSDLEIVAAVLDPKQIARYLKHTGLPAAPPARAGIKMRVVCDE